MSAARGNRNHPPKKRPPKKRRPREATRAIVHAVGMKGRMLNIDVMKDPQGRPLMFRAVSTGPNDTDFTYDDAQHLDLQMPFQTRVLKFAIGKTAYAILPMALKNFLIEGDPGPGRMLVIRTQLGPEFRLGGEMARRVVEFCTRNGPIVAPPGIR